MYRGISYPPRGRRHMRGRSVRGVGRDRSTNAPPSAAFGRTMQFITAIKLQEREKQHLSYQEHSKVIAEADAAGDDLPRKVEILLEAVRSWSGSGALTGTGAVGANLDLSNLDLWLLQARKDPSFSVDVLRRWADTLQAHIEHSHTRFACAKLFGNLFNEWLSSGDSVTAVANLRNDEVEVPQMDTESFVEIGRKELHDQKERLNSIIFTPPIVDSTALESYLTSLFGDEAASRALHDLRKDIVQFGKYVRRNVITANDIRWTISSLLSSDLMDEEKRNTLKEFTENSDVMDEVASVLNMRLASLNTWSWPEGGVVIEMRRHLNGKYRAFTDPDILDALFLQYLGVTWQVKFKQVFRDVFRSKAWKSSLPPFSKAQNDRRQFFLCETANQESIETHRQRLREKEFLVSRLPDTTLSTSSYEDSPNSHTSGVAESAVATKQRLLHLLVTECHLNKALHCTSTVVRTDLEWFGPSLPHESILIILAFFGVPQQWLDFFSTFLRMPLKFKEEPSAQLRTRERGTPISYALSALFGEVILFGMDFAVNQRADGLFLYRIHDDLWFWDADASKCVAAWKEMKQYASLVGLKFNYTKTGSACVDGMVHPELPAGDIRWGFLKFDSNKVLFTIDQDNVDTHIVELRRQLTAAKSVFGWVNAYNKYMKFFVRNFGGPAQCFGREHVDEVINTLARIQTELFPNSDSTQGGAVGHLRRMIAERFGITDLPQGYFYFPIGGGGLEVHDPMIEMFCLRASLFPEPESAFKKQIELDLVHYDNLKEHWENSTPNMALYSPGVSGVEFMSFEEYTAFPARLLRRETWGSQYMNQLSVPIPSAVMMTPFVGAALGDGWMGSTWMEMNYYEKWIVSMFGEEVVRKFGGLEVVDRTLIPVGLVRLFRSSRMKWEQ